MIRSRRHSCHRCAGRARWCLADWFGGTDSRSHPPEGRQIPLGGSPQKDIEIDTGCVRRKQRNLQGSGKESASAGRITAKTSRDSVVNGWHLLLLPFRIAVLLRSNRSRDSSVGIESARVAPVSSIQQEAPSRWPPRRADSSGEPHSVAGLRGNACCTWRRTRS